MPLPHGTLTGSVIGALYAVYNALGHGFVESLYLSALARELGERGHRVEREFAVTVCYKGRPIGVQRLDLVVDRVLVVDVKATPRLHASAARQLYNCLHATRLEVGLLLHFGPAPAFYRVAHLRAGRPASEQDYGSSRSSSQDPTDPQSERFDACPPAMQDGATRTPAPMRIAGVLSATLLLLPAVAGAQAPRVTVTLPAGRAAAPVDGRLLFLVSADTAGEPRNQVSDAVGTAQVFGVDVEGWRPGETRTVDASAFGYPLRSMAELRPGRYRVQALVNRYETFRRSDGHTVRLPPDRGEGQQWASKPGNLHSRPQAVTLGANTSIALTLDQEIPPVADFARKETEYVKYVRVRSERLSRFWGRDVELAAWVLLPWGYASHPGARYPLVVNHGHFPSGVDGWRETPPDSTLAPDFSARFNLRGYNRVQQELGWQFYRDWTGPGFPRVLLVQIQHPTPFYDDSYAVNSANNGPYGDAIQYELIPEIERRFRGIGQGWARFTYGGSTGGWEAMAVQTFYPDEYNGAWVACPDPIDFRAYTVVNLYADTNAYYQGGPFKRVPRPGHRNWLGHVDATLEQMNHRELALGSKGRSGDQWDVWQSVYSPVGADGYPKPIWDKLTGTIDRSVAEHWKQNYDLSHILQRDWKTLGPKLRGKLRIYVGDMDNYYLNNAVYLVEDFLRKADPPADAVIDYGDRAEHCWNGDHTRSNAYTRLRYPQMVLPWAVERMLTTAPAGADLRSWRY